MLFRSLPMLRRAMVPKGHTVMCGDQYSWGALLIDPFTIVGTKGSIDNVFPRLDSVKSSLSISSVPFYVR